MPVHPGYKVQEILCMDSRVETAKYLMEGFPGYKIQDRLCTDSRVETAPYLMEGFPEVFVS